MVRLKERRPRAKKNTTNKPTKETERETFFAAMNAIGISSVRGRRGQIRRRRQLSSVQDAALYTPQKWGREEEEERGGGGGGGGRNYEEEEGRKEPCLDTPRHSLGRRREGGRFQA